MQNVIVNLPSDKSTLLWQLENVTLSTQEDRVLCTVLEIFYKFEIVSKFKLYFKNQGRKCQDLFNYTTIQCGFSNTTLTLHSISE